MLIPETRPAWRVVFLRDGQPLPNSYRNRLYFDEGAARAALEEYQNLLDGSAESVELKPVEVRRSSHDVLRDTVSAVRQVMGAEFAEQLTDTIDTYGVSMFNDGQFNDGRQ